VLLRRDEHVLVSTRLVAVLIIPFLVAAFVVRFFFPKNTGRLFAWPIRPTMTSMMLASTYIMRRFGSGQRCISLRRFWYVEHG
jgi:hypothetical protein